jgi:hypothetical protein
MFILILYGYTQVLSLQWLIDQINHSFLVKNEYETGMTNFTSTEPEFMASLGDYLGWKRIQLPYQLWERLLQILKDPC